MREVEKSKKIWKKDGIEWKVLKGKGIDIGPADSPVLPGVKCFDLEHGDANEITKYIKEEFDFVYASHCLEHMHKPKKAILEWWNLVKVGGYIFFTIPDEDLYEQGVFPSRFNPDHKATFTISKTNSWSPVSINVYDLAKSLHGGEIISIVLQDNNYDRTKLTFGPRYSSNIFTANLMRFYWGLKRRKLLNSNFLERFFLRYKAVDQTGKDDTLVQIQCIVKKIN